MMVSKAYDRLWHGMVSPKVSWSRVMRTSKRMWWKVGRWEVGRWEVGRRVKLPYEQHNNQHKLGLDRYVCVNLLYCANCLFTMT